MLGGRPEGVNNTDARARLERGDEIVERGIGLCDLVIHVHQDRNVERINRQARIVCSPRPIVTFCNPRSRTRLRSIRKYSGTSDNVAVGADDRGQPYDVITAARADVGDSHPGFDSKQTHELARFAGRVALFFIMPNRANDIRNGTIGVRKRISRRACIRHELLRRAGYSEYGGNEGSNCYSHHVAGVQSALRPFCLLQRRERSDALIQQEHHLTTTISGI